MSNCKFKIAIKAEDIHNELSLTNKEKYKNLIFTNVELLNDKFLIVDCLALKDEIEECSSLIHVIGH